MLLKREVVQVQGLKKRGDHRHYQIHRALVFYNYENSNKNKVVSLTTVSKINLEKQLLFGKNLNTNTKALGIKRF